MTTFISNQAQKYENRFNRLTKRSQNTDKQTFVAERERGDIGTIITLVPKVLS